MLHTNQTLGESIRLLFTNEYRWNADSAGSVRWLWRFAADHSPGCRQATCLCPFGRCRHCRHLTRERHKCVSVFRWRWGHTRARSYIELAPPKTVEIVPSVFLQTSKTKFLRMQCPGRFSYVNDVRTLVRTQRRSEGWSAYVRIQQKATLNSNEAPARRETRDNAIKWAPFTHTVKEWGNRLYRLFCKSWTISRQGGGRKEAVLRRPI